MKMAIDEAKYTALGIAYENHVTYARFTLPDSQGSIPVIIEDGQLALFPDRAAAHKRLIAALSATA
jgi:hypothetical protein